MDITTSSENRTEYYCQAIPDYFTLCQHLKRVINDRLFELRLQGKSTPELRILAKLQLMIHEAEENG